MALPQEENNKEKKISTGYSAQEISDILKDAESVHSTMENKLANENPTHKPSSLWNRTLYPTDSSTTENVFLEINGQPLRVSLDVTAERDVEVAETRLFSGFDTTSKSAAKHLYFKGDAGLKVSFTCLVYTYDEYIGKHVGSELDFSMPNTVFAVLSDWNRTFQICEVVSSSPMIENGYYRITRFTPTQVERSLISLEMDLVQDTYNYEAALQTRQAMGKSQNTTLGGVNKGGVKPVTTDSVSGGTSPKYTGDAKLLMECNADLKKRCSCTTYKKSSCVTTEVSCVKVLQRCLQKVSLYLDGRVDGLFCYYTHQAVVTYQKRYKDLNATGVVDKATRKRLADDIMGYK